MHRTAWLINFAVGNVNVKCDIGNADFSPRVANYSDGSISKSNFLRHQLIRE